MCSVCLASLEIYAQDDACLFVRTEVLTDTVLETQGAEILVRFSLNCPAQDTVKILPLVDPPNNSPTTNRGDFRNAAAATGVTILPGMTSAVSRIPVTNDEDIEPGIEHFYWDYQVKSNLAYSFAGGSSQIEFWIKDDDNDPANKKYNLSYNSQVPEGEALQIKLTFPSGKRFSDSLKLRFEPEEVAYNALLNKDYSLVVRDIPPFGSNTTIDISALIDQIIEGDELIKGRIIVYDAAWDDPSTYTTNDTLEITIIDQNNLPENRVIEIFPAITELTEGGSITYTLKLKSPYKAERPINVNLNTENLPGYLNHSDTQVILTETDSIATITFNYPDNDIIDPEEVITTLVSADDNHTGDYTFRYDDNTVNVFYFNTLDNDSDIEIPNAFTPNGDGINDTWIIRGIENNRSSLVQVFNRNGEKVFEGRVYANDWNGRKNNKPLPAGVYFYKVFHQKNYPVRTGTLTIMY